MKYADNNTVRAIYTEPEDNPYLAALPELMSKEMFLHRLQSLPAIPADISERSGEERRRMLSDLANLFLPMDYMYMIGKNLRRIRKSQNISLLTVSTDLQMGQHNLGNIERGIGNPEVKTLARLVDYYHVHMKDLFDESGF